ncbi:MAG: SDR family oxidoreductase [bacterium]
MTDLVDKWVLITGAARGMGKRMAKRFGEEGARIAAVDLAEDELNETVEELQADGITVEPFVCDLSQRENIDSLRDEVHDEIGSVDIIVNNAGVVQGGQLEEISDEEDELTFDVNIKAVHWVTKKFLPDLKEAEDSHIIQMASAAGMIGVPDQVVYSASKWFVIGFSRALRQELQSYGEDQVNMTIVSPSLVDTGMFEGAEPPLLMPILQPDYMADKIVEAVKNNDLFVREPFMLKLLPFFKGVLPIGAVDFMLDKLGARDLMNHWTGRS